MEDRKPCCLSASAFHCQHKKPSRETDPSPGRLSERHCSREVPVLLACAGVRPCPLFLTRSLPETLKQLKWLKALVQFGECATRQQSSNTKTVEQFVLSPNEESKKNPKTLQIYILRMRKSSSFGKQGSKEQNLGQSNACCSFTHCHGNPPGGLGLWRFSCEPTRSNAVLKSFHPPHYEQ